MDFHGDKDVMLDAQPELMTVCQVSEFYTAEGVCGGSTNLDTGPSCFSDAGSSSSQYLSAEDAVLSIEHSRTEPNYGEVLEREIEVSKVHWSELSSQWDSDDDDGESNREIFDRLLQMPQYLDWLTSHNFHPSDDDIVIGQKLAEGGQAEIFAVEDRCMCLSPSMYVLKVFKRGYSLRNLQFQWPKGILNLKINHSIVCGGLVLEDGRFAFLLQRHHVDLPKLIDIARERNSPLWEQNRRPLQEFGTYEPKTRGPGRSKQIFKDRCALEIMHNLAWEMSRLHSIDVLHRDLKASNILCTECYGGDIICSM